MRGSQRAEGHDAMDGIMRRGAGPEGRSTMLSPEGQIHSAQLTRSSERPFGAHARVSVEILADAGHANSGLPGLAGRIFHSWIHIQGGVVLQRLAVEFSREPFDRIEARWPHGEDPEA